MSIRRKVLTVVMALAVVAGAGTYAQAELGAIGPVDPATGFPAWVGDKAGLKLNMCPGGDPNCLAVAPDPNNAFEVAIGFGGIPAEGFWWDAEATVGGPPPAPEASLILAVEATFGTVDGSAVDGNQWAFNRIRLRASGLPLNTACTVIHPFSSAAGDILTTDGAGDLNFTSDFGCQTGVPALPCGAADYALMATPVPPTPGIDPWGNAISVFLRAVTPPPPIGYIGNPNILQTVTGSPTGNNVFTVSCPPLAPLTTNLFTLQGKIFDTLGVTKFIAKGDFDGNGVEDLAAIDTAGVAWVSTDLTAWTKLNPVPGVQFAKVVSGDFNNARGGDEVAGLTTDGRVFLYNDLLNPTELPRTIGVIVSDIVAGDFNGARNGMELAGVATDGRVLAAADMTVLQPTAAGKLSKILAFNFDGLPTDLIGVSAAGKIWMSTDLGQIWTSVPGTLAQIVSGDFNGDGLDDLGGLSAAGKIWFNTVLDTNPLNWVNVPGTLGKIVAGNFADARVGDEIAGVNATTRKLWVAVSLQPAAWVNLAGTGDQLIPIDFDTARPGAEMAMLNAVSGKVWTSPDGLAWTLRNP